MDSERERERERERENVNVRYETALSYYCMGNSVKS